MASRSEAVDAESASPDGSMGASGSPATSPSAVVQTPAPRSSSPSSSFNSQTLERCRAETNLVRSGRIHLNNAGAAPMPDPVLARVRDYLEMESELGGYEAADAVAAELETVYDGIAELLGTQARNIALVENATAAYAQALSAFDFRPGDVILTSSNDYVSNQLMFLSLQRRHGVQIVRAEDLPSGGVDPDSVRGLGLHHKPKLIALTHVPTNSGLIQEVEAVGKICRELEIPYLLDACQSVGQIEVNAAAIGCDFLCATGRKFLRGPRGTGFLYVSDDMLAWGRAPLLIDLRGAEWLEPDRFRAIDSARRFENWEFNIAAVLGLGVATRYALDLGLASIEGRVRRLAAQLRSALAERSWARVLDRGNDLCAIVSVACAGHEAEPLMQTLRARGVNTSLISRSSAVLDMDNKGVSWGLRLSPHYFVSEQEIKKAVAVLDSLSA